MKSDLTCPVEVTKVAVNRETYEQDGETQERIFCDIAFFNLSKKVIDSVQMHILCLDEQGVRLGGRLVRATALGGPRDLFQGAFLLEHVSGVTQVEASVEKVWFQDGVVWRHEEQNVCEYQPNQLPEGHELDRLRTVAGEDAVGYACEDDAIWMCVCGRANRREDAQCVRCERTHDDVFARYTYAVIDATIGQKERNLQRRTEEALRRSSEENIRAEQEAKAKRKRRKRWVNATLTVLILVAVLLATVRWGVPVGLEYYAQKLQEEGQWTDAQKIYTQILTYWPDEYNALEKINEAEVAMIERFIQAGTADALDEAMKRAQQLDPALTEAGQHLFVNALLARAELDVKAGKKEEAQARLVEWVSLDEAVRDMNRALIYEIAEDAREHLKYPTAIARFASLGDDRDAQEQVRSCTYDYGRQLMREKQYEAACEQLLLVADRGDAIELVRQCRYRWAQDLQKDGELIQAAQLYESLGVYESAENLAKQCRYQTGMRLLGEGNLEDAAAQLRLADTYEDAQARYADTVKTLGFAALEEKRYSDAVAWLEQLPKEGETADALNQASYAYALQLEAEGSAEAASLLFSSLGGYQDSMTRAKQIEYNLAMQEAEHDPEAAMERFEALGTYKDASDQAKACRYRVAENLYDEGAYEEAMVAFVHLGSYQDAALQVKRSRYALADEWMEKQDYMRAASLYEACGTYLDAEDAVMRAQYAQAAAYDAEGQYEQAALAFAALGSYEDAKMRVMQSEDSWLKEAFSSARMDMELGNYAGVLTTLEPYWQESLPKRYAEIKKLYEQACIERAQTLIDMGRPLDALPLLEKVRGVYASAEKKLDAYVYRIVGRWKDVHGVEYLFRRDGSCAIAGQEGFFGGSGYSIAVSNEPYPTKETYTVVNLKGKTLTLRKLDSGELVRLTGVDGESQSENQSENP